MLSDEERKAIDYLQLCYDLSTITNESLSKLGIVLNLIEKQSKEIEEYKKQLDLDNECEIALNSKIMDLEKEIEQLKDKNKTLKNLQNDTNGLYIGMIERKNYFERELQKLEDKIKAKIEELENEKEKYFEKQVIQHEIEILQSLLEKE